jgi:glucose-6-phosphate 1-dehydrogenase
MITINDSSPIALVIFGVTGDLTRRKLMPALYQLHSEKRLLSPLHIIGFARRPWSNEELSKELSAGIREFARKNRSTRM